MSTSRQHARSWTRTPSRSSSPPSGACTTRWRASASRRAGPDCTTSAPVDCRPFSQRWPPTPNRPCPATLTSLDHQAGDSSVAEAVRIRDALDPLLIEDALWHSSSADIAAMRQIIAEMALAVDRYDPTAFVQANWRLHARIAAVSPHQVLRSLYLTLLEQIEAHT